MPLAEWPAQDQAAWQSALAPTDFLQEGGIAAAWSVGGRTMASDGYGFWLTWLVNSRQFEPSLPPADRVSRERIAAYAAAMRQRLAPMTVLGRIRSLGRAMNALAPHRDWTWLGRAANRMLGNAIPVRLKRARMQDVDRLVALGTSLMQGADRTDDHLAVGRATRYRDGLIIALLAYRPLRLRSFAGLTVDQHLSRRPTGWWLQLSPHDTKTKQAMEMPFPEELVSCLETYLAQHRPVLLRGNAASDVARPHTTGLWIAKGGRMMGACAISVQIKGHTAAAFGQPINPHLFRDCAATSIAIQDPEHVRVIHAILGHSTLATSERFYNQARTLEAGRRYQQEIAQTRSDAQETRA